MSTRNLLVAFNGSDSAETALRYAASIARATGAHVTALVAHSTHETVSSQAPWVPAKAREIIAAANADILADTYQKLEALSASLGLEDRFHTLKLAGQVDTVIAETARGFDMLIVGQPVAGDADEHLMLHPDRIALLSGRPVLAVPNGYDREARHDRAAVAWDGSRASARALYDSLQLLEDDGKVTLLTIDGTDLPRPVEEVTAQLERHGISTQHTALPLNQGVARTLLAYAQDTDPCMLVMGAYEHSKFREDFLGGVTTRVLKAIHIPVLISH